MFNNKSGAFDGGNHFSKYFPFGKLVTEFRGESLSAKLFVRGGRISVCMRCVVHVQPKLVRSLHPTPNDWLERGHGEGFICSSMAKENQTLIRSSAKKSDFLRLISEESCS